MKYGIVRYKDVKGTPRCENLSEPQTPIQICAMLHFHRAQLIFIYFFNRNIILIINVEGTSKMK